ncbi:MAG: hypothetical protein ABIG61_02375 [Planctomycetota bacterium]
MIPTGAIRLKEGQAGVFIGRDDFKIALRFFDHGKSYKVKASVSGRCARRPVGMADAWRRIFA